MSYKKNRHNLPLIVTSILIATGGVGFPAFSDEPLQKTEKKGPQENFMVVDLLQIITESLVSQDIQKQLREKSDEYQKEFSNQDQKFRSENEKLISSQNELKPEEIQKKQMDLQKRFEAFQEKIDLRRRQLEMCYRKGMEEVQKKVDQLVQRLAEEKKLSRVYREAAFAWVRDSKNVDMTPEVLSLLNKELPKVTIKIPTEKEIVALISNGDLVPPKESENLPPKKK